MIDHDVVTSALLESLGHEIDTKRAGGICYEIEWALIYFHLSQGQSVILDSPCLYETMVDRGTSLVAKHAAKYKYVECILDDIEELNHRLATRQRVVSQIGAVDIPADRVNEVINRSKKPTNMECIRVDTSRSIDAYIAEVLTNIDK